jgi:hypothetical protein
MKVKTYEIKGHEHSEFIVGTAKRAMARVRELNRLGFHVSLRKVINQGELRDIWTAEDCPTCAAG